MSTSNVRRYALTVTAMSVAAALFVKGGTALDAACALVLSIAFVTTFGRART